MSPLDIAMSRAEKRLYRRSEKPGYPIVLVCGPPRSGTTLVAQYLINHLDVGYLNNLSSIFPRSPLIANKVFGMNSRNVAGSYDAFYGKSQGLNGVNDGLHIWDRWLGPDRENPCRKLVEDSEESMKTFFGALQAQQERATICKVNRAFLCASLVLQAVPEVHVMFVRRDPVMLAQSLYLARKEITRDLNLPYGVTHEDRVFDDAVEDVCRQVEFYYVEMDKQLDQIASEKYTVINYEEFCGSPAELVQKLTNSLAIPRKLDAKPAVDEVFKVSNRRRIPEADLAKIQGHFQKK